MRTAGAGAAVRRVQSHIRELFQAQFIVHVGISANRSAGIARGSWINIGGSLSRSRILYIHDAAGIVFIGHAQIGGACVERSARHEQNTDVFRAGARSEVSDLRPAIIIIHAVLGIGHEHETYSDSRQHHERQQRNHHGNAPFFVLFHHNLLEAHDSHS